MTLIRYLFTFMFVCVASLLFVGHYNDLHPLLDSISHFRIHFLFIILGITLFLLLLSKGTMRYLYLLLLVSFGIYTFMMMRPYPFDPLTDSINGRRIVHLQFNMNYRNKNVDAFKAFVKRKNPDIITLQEVTKAHQSQLETLKDVYPYQSYCAFYPVVGGVAILSRYPFSNNSSVCVEGEGLVIETIKIDKIDLTVASLHLHWPYPYGQYKQVESLRPHLEKLPSPLLLSGDFNAAPWSHIVQSIAIYTDTKVVKGLHWSIELSQQLPYIPNMKLPIDHLLISKDLRVISIEAMEHFGSDHYAILSEVEL